MRNYPLKSELIKIFADSLKLIAFDFFLLLDLTTMDSSAQKKTVKKGFSGHS
jgi:hypothetical protein